MVSPAPPSKSTLSGNTTAARPCCLRMVKMGWRKLSCLLLVLAQKSSRLMMSDSLEVSPSSLEMGTLLFLPKGGLARTMSYSPCLDARASLVTTGRSGRIGIAADAVEQEIHPAEARDAVDQFDAEERFVVQRLLLRAVEVGDRGK